MIDDCTDFMKIGQPELLETSRKKESKKWLFVSLIGVNPSMISEGEETSCNVTHAIIKDDQR